VFQCFASKIITTKSRQPSNSEEKQSDLGELKGSPESGDFSKNEIAVSKLCCMFIVNG